MTRAQRAVFLDRDGVLNEEVNYLHRIEDFRWIPGAPEAVRKLNEAGLLVLVVTNQAGVAHGYYGEEEVEALHVYMREELAKRGAHVDAFYYSPHHPEAAVPAYRSDSPFRKPGTGMFERALHEWPVDAARSFMVGDKESDMIPAKKLGLTAVLVETGYGHQQKAVTTADIVLPDIGAAVDWMLARAS